MNAGHGVREEFVFRIPENLTPAAAAPLLRAGITTYSPLRRWQVGAGQKVGVAGLGGLGRMAVKFARRGLRTDAEERREVPVRDRHGVAEVSVRASHRPLTRSRRWLGHRSTLQWQQIPDEVGWYSTDLVIFKNRGGGHESRPTVKAIADAARRGDGFACEVMRIPGERLRRALLILVDLFNPERVVMAGFFRSAANGSNRICAPLWNASHFEFRDAHVKSSRRRSLGATMGSHAAIAAALHVAGETGA